MRKVAVATLLCFGCATVRVPVSASGAPADAAGTVAPPLLELWLESSEAVRPEEQAQAERQARAAIDAALARHPVGVGALGAGDAVLFVRERAVALTPARRSQQVWAKVGIIAGIAVVVAVVVIAAIAKKDSGRSTPSKPASTAKAARPAPAAVAVKPRAAAAGASSPSTPRARPVAAGARPTARPATPPPARPPPPPRVYVYGGYAPTPLFFDLQFYYAPRPLVLRPEEPAPDGPYPGAPPPPEDEAAASPASAPSAALVASAAQQSASGFAGAPAADSDDAQPGESSDTAPALLLPPLAPAVDFAVEERGFFSGAKTSLQLDLLDRKTGAVLWSKAVAGDNDPLNPAEVGALLDEALDGAAWARRAR